MTIFSLRPTLELRQAELYRGGQTLIPWQSGLPLATFDPQDRPHLDLGGGWRKQRFSADHDITMAARDDLSALEAEAAGRHLPEYDDSHWPLKTLPMVENEMPDAPYVAGPERYEGGVWYRRSVAVPAEWRDTRVTLTFLAANYVLDVWVNGRWVGYHEGGYTPFAFDVSAYLNYGAANCIALRVDNPPWDSRDDTLPATTPDWWNYTGIIHDLYLESAPMLYIVRADALTPDLSGKVEARVVLYNASDTSQSRQLSLTIYEADAHAPGWLTDPRASVITGSPVNVARFPVTVGARQALVIDTVLQIPNPVLWSTASPCLYVLQAQIGADKLATQFGIRTITADSYRLLLNGEPTFLSGLARHEEWPQSGRSATWEGIAADLQLIQGLGANFVRTAHYPNHVYTYIALDRLGLLAAVEIPVWQATEHIYAVQERRRIADQMWREMIFSNRNRPSVILWSSNNESREIPFRQRYIERLLADYQANYPDGRLITQSAAADCDGPSDASQAPLDVAGWTMYFGIFHGSTYYQGTKDFLEAAHAAYPDRPLLNTEYGIWSYGGDSDETRQQEVFRETFRALAECTPYDASGAPNPGGFLAGLTWWTVFDWYTSQTVFQTMGLYKMDRQTAKPVARLLREAYRVWAEKH